MGVALWACGGEHADLYGLSRPYFRLSGDGAIINGSVGPDVLTLFGYL